MGWGLASGAAHSALKGDPPVTKHLARRSALALILVLLTARVSTTFAQSAPVALHSSQSASFDPGGTDPDPTGGDPGGPDVAIH